MIIKSTSRGLALELLHNGEMKTLCIDFSNARLQFRINRALHQGEPLLKAFGLKQNHEATIVDATAGFAQDAFLLAHLGFKMILFEKHELIFKLIEDALNRARNHPKLAPTAQRIKLFHGDACKHFHLLEKPDYIYLDPMFPEKKKSALSKQSMEILKKVCDSSEQPLLLTKALQIAQKRVVIKRPLHAPYLANKKPSFSQRYQSCRFDIFSH